MPDKLNMRRKASWSYITCILSGMPLGKIRKYNTMTSTNESEPPFVNFGETHMEEE